LNIVTIYENIYIYFQKILNFNLLSPVEFILLILFIYLFFGALSGFLGVYIGKKVKALIPKNSALEVTFSNEELFPLSGNQKFNLYLLTLNIILIPFGLLFISKNIIYFGLPFLISFIGYTYWRYTAIFRRLKKPIFWGQLIIIVLLSGFFYSNESNQIFDLKGLYFGLEMSFRAVFIVIAFTAISIELRNPSIKKFLYAHHLGALHGSLSLAFNSLPIMIKSLPPIKHFFKQPLTTLSKLIAYNIRWYSIFKSQIKKEID